MGYKRPESALVIVYTQGGEVLMLRRRHPRNFWQSVTGSLEWGEAPLQAAIRELREETGLINEGIRDCHYSRTFEIYPIWRERYAPGVTQNREHVFRLQLPEKVDIHLDEEEHEKFIWLPRTQAAGLASSHTNRAAILHWVGS